MTKISPEIRLRMKLSDIDIDPPSAGEALVLCISCQAAIDPAEIFCPACGAPVSTAAGLDPIDSIRAEGFLIQKAADRRPSLIVLIGMWLLFAPLPIVGLGVAGSILIDGAGSGMTGFFFFWGGVGLAIIGIVVLAKVTRNYFRSDVSADL